MGKLIDVIIPMYNSESYIQNLIQNLEKQTMKDFRAIFVDDGSKDNTVEVLQKQLERVSFSFLVLMQENHGAAAARNYGLRISDAEWTVFIDSDDSLSSKYLEYLYQAVSTTNADLGVCRFKMVPDSFEAQEWVVGEMDISVMTAAECMEKHYTEWFAPVCLIISRELRIKNELFFDEECKYCEDIPFITKVIEVSNLSVYINNVLYFYWTHQGSLSRSPKIHKFLSGIEGFQRVEQQMEESQTKPAAVFREMGSVRYYIGTLRKASVQMPYKDFSRLAEIISFKKYGKQLRNIALKQRIAGYLLLISKRLFYYTVRLLYKD